MRTPCTLPLDPPLQNYFEEVHSSLVIVAVKRKGQDTKSCRDFKESFCRPIQNLPQTVHRAARSNQCKI